MSNTTHNNLEKLVSVLSKAVNVLAERSDVLAQRLAPPPEKAKCEWRTAVLAILHPCVPNVPDPLLPHHVANPEVACDIYTLLLLIKDSDLDQWLTHLTLPAPWPWRGGCSSLRSTLLQT
jgi:hypothetical protein